MKCRKCDSEIELGSAYFLTVLQDNTVSQCEIEITELEEQNEIKNRIVRSINLLLGTTYESYNESLEKYQEAKSLSITSSMNLETGRVLQKELYDYYLLKMESFMNTYIGE